MGSALAKAAAKRVPGGKIMISDSSQSRISAVAGELGCATGTATQVVGGSKYVFIGVKPQNMSELFKEILPVLAHKKERTVLVSMAAGVTTERLTELAGTDVPVIRIMPNTPVEVEEGCVLYTCAGGVTEEELSEFLEGMGAAGSFIRMEERLIDAGCAISGCGPAFVYQFIMALTKAGVNCGLPEETSRMLSEQTVLGAAKLAIGSGEAPEKLCGDVCSPGGATIEGVKVMEAGPFAAEVAASVDASFKRTVELGRS